MIAPHASPAVSPVVLASTFLLLVASGCGAQRPLQSTGGGGACTVSCVTSAGGSGNAATSATGTATSSSGGGGDAGGGDDASDAGAPPPTIDTTGPIGLDKITSFAELPYLRTATRALHESSYDRTGANNDWSLAPNYLRLDQNGDKVLLDSRGPGCVYRIWFTGQDPSQSIHVYFDDEAQPSIDMDLGDFFSGTTPPFLAPLVANDQVSSGGFFNYVPLPFSKAIRITASGTQPDYYFNIDYQLFDPGTAVTTWTGQEDTSAARALWTNRGAYPDDVTGSTAESAILSVPAGQAQTILDVDGPREIVALQLSVAGVFPVHPVTFTDNGRAHKGTSSFTLKLDPTNEGAVLQRRLDHGVADQTATVSVDGAVVGTWTDRGSDATNHWRDDFFQIPASDTKGKASVDVTITFVSSANDWNEFYYWAYSRVQGAEVLTDQLDVGDAPSESAHAYAVTQATWSGMQTYTYPEPSSFAPPLDDLHIRISWDGEAMPSVDAPIGSFFAQGEFGPGFVDALPAGMSADGTMYLYFPMPFSQHAKVELVNTSNTDIDDVWYRVLHKPFTDSFANVGTFKVAYAGAVASQPNEDAIFVDTDGAGQVVGVVESMLGPSTPSNYLYLEGDEHVFIDGRRTPSLQGTGTEDFYNGGWYFDHGLFSQPTHGFAAWTTTPTTDARAMHRFFLADAIPFRSHIRFGIQHGGTNDVAVTSSMLAYYYAQPAPRATLGDTLVVGDAASETSHAYAVMGQTWQGSPSDTFGEPDFIAVTQSGRAHQGTSRFTMAVDPNNKGVLLRRMMDYGVGNQAADVYVGGVLAGRWYTAGKDATNRWRDDEFWLPKAVTAGQAQLDILIKFVSSDVDWNEFSYEAYSVSE